jgi:hypothetical protein
MSKQTTESRSFDQIVKGNVTIKKLSSHRYRITFSKIDDFLLYQVWDKDSVKLNKKRKVGYVSAKKWVAAVKKYNKEVENSDSDKPLFTPTTIMETEDDNYAFVIHNAYLNSHGQVVFTVSTKEISLQNNTSKKLVRLPCGKCNNVRFDIDFTFTLPFGLTIDIGTIISMEYDSQAYGYSIYKNVKNTETNQQLTQTDLKNILSSYNIEFYRNGTHYDINTKNKLDLGNNSIRLQKCVGCGKPGFSFYVSSSEKDLISTVQINTLLLFPPDVDPTKITYINFVGN